MNYWQVGCGADERDYSQVMYDFGVAIVGPGDPGSFPEHKEEYDEESRKKIQPLFRMKCGDRIVLKNGRKQMLAVGEVIGEYGYSRLFSDIDGWDLGHYIEVDWRELSNDFGKNVLSMATLQRLDVKEVIDFIEKNWAVKDRKEKKYSLRDVPVVDGLITSDKLESFLIRKGLRIERAENMTRTIHQVEKLSKWYLHEGKDVSSEHEIRTFLVIPFLLALGWSEQRIGIEVPIGNKKRVDVVIYDNPQRKSAFALVETKRIWTGFYWAHHQLKEYSHSFPPVKYLIATDGLRYSLHEKKDDSWHYTAYMNFRKMLDRHTCYEHIKGTTYLISKMIPTFMASED